MVQHLNTNNKVGKFVKVDDSNNAHNANNIDNIGNSDDISDTEKTNKSEGDESIAIAWLRLARCSGASKIINPIVRSGAYESVFEILNKVLQAKKLADSLNNDEPNNGEFDETGNGNIFESEDNKSKSSKAYKAFKTDKTSKAAKTTAKISKIFIPSESDILREMESIKAFGAQFIHVGHSLYPLILGKIANPVIGLTVKGNVSLLSKNASRLAIVGTRTPSVASVCLVKNFVKGLMESPQNDDCELGVCVVSGLAYGIDGAAHRYAIDYSKNCNTIGVIGCGINMCYPLDHADLQEKISVSGGLLVSEFKFGSQPTRYTFPLRNRIIAAISDGVLVMEARSGSGSLITAKYANDFGIPLFSVGGSPMDSRYNGNNSLIKNGKAKMVDNADDLIAGIVTKNIAWLNKWLNNYDLNGSKSAKFAKFGSDGDVVDRVDVSGGENGSQSENDSECFGFVNYAKEPEYEFEEDFSVNVEDKDEYEVTDFDNEFTISEKLTDRIAKAMSSTPVSVSQICEALNANNKDVTLALVDLELDNIVEKDENGMFYLNFANI